MKLKHKSTSLENYTTTKRPAKYSRLVTSAKVLVCSAFINHHSPLTSQKINVKLSPMEFSKKVRNRQL
jgi:hypothetical protein